MQASKQMLLLAHLYAKTDAASLAKLRGALLQPRYTTGEIATGTGVGVTVVAGALPDKKSVTRMEGQLSSFFCLVSKNPSHFPIVECKH